MSNTHSYIEQALGRVTKTLTHKAAAWTPSSPEFEQFDSQKEIGIDPLQFALGMTRLKWNRAKNRFLEKQRAGGSSFGMDADLEDSVLDLACYAIIALALQTREVDRGREANKTTEN